MTLTFLDRPAGSTISASMKGWITLRLWECGAAQGEQVRVVALRNESHTAGLGMNYRRR